ncbi:nitrous oxide-stimulated promoter family protein [Chloroflexota bacterium]
MSELFNRLDSKKSKDIKVLGNFISIFCRENHGEADRDELPIKDARIRNILGDKDLVLCSGCQKLISHSIAKLMQCPYDPKPMCKKCETHCYAPDYRERIREVMRFSGLYLVKHGRVDLMMHYFF